MSTLSARLDTFRRQLLDRLAAAEGADPAIAEEAAALKALLAAPLPAPSAVPPPRHQAATVFLGAALAAGLEGPEASLAEAIQALAPHLAWSYGYPFDPLRPSLGKTIAFADILGKSGLGSAADVVTGLTLIAPQTLYPLHAHPAIELYLVMSGSAGWQAGSAPPQIKAPGSLILHPSNVPHSTETTLEPLLALYTWRGDLVSPSVFLPSEASLAAGPTAAGKTFRKDRTA